MEENVSAYGMCLAYKGSVDVRRVKDSLESGICNHLSKN